MPVGQGGTGGTVYGLLCPSLGVGPAGGAGALKLDGGFAGCFVLGEGAIELGKDFVSGFDGEEGKAVYIADLEAYTRV